MNIKGRFVSLKTKIIFSTLIPIVISFSLIIAVIFSALFTSLHETAKAEFLQISQKYSSDFEGNINHAIDYLSIVASILELQIETETADREALQREVLHIFDDYQLIDGSSIYFEPNLYDGKDTEYIGTEYGTAMSGRICYYFYKNKGKTSYLPEGISNDIEFTLPHYADAKEANKPIYTEPTAHEIDGRLIPMFTITYPVRSAGGRFVGAVTVDLFLEDIHVQLQNEKIYNTGYITIANDKGQLIYSPIFKDIGKTAEETGQDYAMPSENEKTVFKESKSILNGKDTFVTVDSLYIPKLDSYFYVTVAAPTDEINKSGMRLIAILAAISVIIVIAIALLLYYLIGKILMPIKKITESATKIASGDMDEASKLVSSIKSEKAIDEVDTLYEAIKKMLVELNEMQQLRLEGMELKYEKEKAETEVQAKSEFLARMSHEIRTPMNAIIGMTELVLREEISPRAYEHAHGIKNAGNNLLSIINDILDFSKIESGKLEIVASEYMFTSLINDVINIIRMRTIEKQLLFTVNLNSDIPAKLIGDEIRIRQILVNLLGNAVKYTREGFISMMIDCEIRYDNTVLLRIEISDSGIGIKQKDMDKLFENFSQMDTLANKGVQGTGLGLAITKSLCLAMNGDVSVKSEYGKGSVFTAAIPQSFREYEKFASVPEPSEKSVLLYEPREIYAASIAKTIDNLGVLCVSVQNDADFRANLESSDFSFVFVSSALFESAKKVLGELETASALVLLTGYGEIISENNVKTISMPATTISIANLLNDAVDYTGYGDWNNSIGFSAPSAKLLIVDDIETNLKVAGGLLAPYNMQIDTCMSGVEAIKKAEAVRYDMILMDHMMPEMDGIEATRRIRGSDAEHCASVPIVALTANAIYGMREVFMENGFSDYLTKPIEIAKLNEILDKWIPKEKRQKKTAAVAEEAADFEIPGLNIQKGIMYSGGLDNYLDVLTSYAADGEIRLKEIVKCHEAGELKTLTTYVHALKSASASIGAEELSQSVAKLEAAGLNGDTDYIDGNLPLFTDQLEEILSSLKAHLKRGGQKQMAPEKAADYDFLQKAVSKLGDSLEIVDIESIESVLAELDTYAWDEKVSAQLDRMKSCISVFDYDSADEALTELEAIKHER